MGCIQLFCPCFFSNSSRPSPDDPHKLCADNTKVASIALGIIAAMGLVYSYIHASPILASIGGAAIIVALVAFRFASVLANIGT